jgi:hypothetical protein
MTMRSRYPVWLITFAFFFPGGASLRAQSSDDKQERLKHRFHRGLAQQVESFLQQNISVAQAKKLGDGLERSIDRLSARDPESEPLQILYCQLAVALSFAFKEDESPEKAELLYQKTQAKSSQLLKQRYPKHYVALTKGPITKTKAALKVLKKSDLPALFWYSFALGLETNLVRSTSLLIQLPRQRMLMEWVLERDEAIFNGGPHLSLGLTCAAFPKAAGGDLKKALTHFEAIERITKRRWLMARVIRAKYFSVALQNEVPKKATAKDREYAGKLAWHDFFLQLESVAKSPDNLWPSRNLYNAVARAKAVRMLKHADDYIFPPKGFVNPYEESE